MVQDLFTREISKNYDEKNRNLAPIADNMHFLVRFVLQDMPVKSHILCVGVGTGAEIFSLAACFPEWTFVGVDPSAPMLEICQERLNDAGIAERCSLIHGYIDDVPADQNFDAVLSILVGHFIKRDGRVQFYKHIRDRLKNGGYFVNTEISYDLDSQQFPAMLGHWEKVQSLMGATPESLQALPDGLRNILSVLPPHQVEEMIVSGGFSPPVRFFQSFLIHGWYAVK